MAVFEIWQHWLEWYGGFKTLLVAMCIFLGGYTLLVGCLDNPGPGRRRALALFCLALGLLVGNIVGNMSGQTLETKMKWMFKSLN